MSNAARIKTVKLPFNCLYEAIAASGESGIPSGHLYARLIGDMDLATYQQCVNMLVRSGLVTNTNDLLTASAVKVE